MCAVLIWIFGQYGVGAGIVGICITFFTIMRIVVVYGYMAAWTNPTLSKATRQARLEWGDKTATVGRNHNPLAKKAASQLDEPSEGQLRRRGA